LDRGESAAGIDCDLSRIAGLSEADRASIWALTWNELRRHERSWNPSISSQDQLPARSGAPPDPDQAIATTLERARRETEMDVAVLGEIRDGHEVVRLLAGDGQSFGMSVGSAIPIEESYCRRLLEGRLHNIVPDTRSDALLKDLAVTKLASVGAYIGVPVTTLQARLYILCCLAHEQRPSLSERHLFLLRRLAQDVAAELSATAIS
jgi:GAF domain-containing protein